MEPIGSRYAVVLNTRALRQEFTRDTNLHAGSTVRPRGGSCTSGLSGLATLAVAAGLVLSVTLGLRLITGSTAEAWHEPVNELPANIEVAQALTAALNAHDVDAVVELFTEEDSGPTVNADAYAWQKFEIGLWAQQQVQASIHIDAYDYQLIEHGATWNADLYRDDWRQQGLDPLPVTNTIWVHHGRLANFTSTPRNPHDAEVLGRLWRPGVSPEHPPK